MKRSSLAACSVALAVLLVSSFALNSAYATNSLPTGMRFLTTEKLYVAGQTVRLLGQIFSSSPGTQMLITVYAPDNKATLSHRLDSPSPIVEFTFVLDENETRYGEWKVVAIYADQQAEATFILTDKNSFHRTILNKPILTDILGEPLVKEKQKAKQPMAISAEIENDEESASQQFVFLTQVLDENKVPVHISFALGSVGPGQSANPTVSWTPTEGGAYTVEVFVWNSLGTPVPLADKQASTFEILA